MSDCIDVIAKAADGRLSDDDIADIAERMARARDAAGQLENVETELLRRGQVIVDEMEKAALVERRQALQNLVKENELLDMSERAFDATGDAAAGLAAIMVGQNARFLGGKRSVDAIGQGLFSARAGAIIADMKEAGVERAFRKMIGDLELEVAEALADLSRTVKRNPTVSSDARKIAQIWHKYQMETVRVENDAGAYIRLRQGHVARGSHDPYRLRRYGENEFVSDMRARLDFDRMEVAPDQVDEFLRETYRGLESGIRLTDEATPIEKAFKGPGNLAKRESAHRVLLFKSATDEVEYVRKYGAGSLREALWNDIERGARATAMMRAFGTNPRAMFDRVKEKLLERHRTDQKARKQLGGRFESLEAQFAEISGEVNRVDPGVGQSVATVFSAYRAIQTMAKLGGSVISALSDVAFFQANRQFMGRGMLGSWNDTISGIVSGFAGGEKRVFADRLAAGLEGMIGSHAARFNGGEEFSGRIAKLQQGFFRLNLLGPWSDATKRGHTFIIANDLASVSSKRFDALSDAHRNLLNIYGIDARQWDVARQAVRKGPDGRDYLFPGDIENVRGGVFTGMTEYQQTQFRQHVQENVFALFVHEADIATPTPGARERAFMRRGYQPGTVAGESLRFMGQFKGFPAGVLSKVIGRHAYGHGAKNMREAITQKSSIVGLANVIATTTVLGYIISQLKQLAAGKEMQEPSAKALIAGFMQGGGAGIYGDFLFGEYNRYGGGLLSNLAGPALGSIDDAAKVFGAFRDMSIHGEGDPWAQTIRLVKSNLPYANLFYTKQTMDYLIWYQLQEMTNPGYLSRMERRVERDTGQEFWLRPSDVVARGGGFR